ncbi:MAG: Uncharacterized methyltransferase SCO7062 [uncultured Nocardioidaceae bacterium]|uniref:Uncharacterized methyltransferase SCO7062 n=1 Tax=uncultured Nocardioidaceae bacterium TaxID=253824 RepID=A0A6J4M1I4_9ACTN|nr:MAG: Uncharacterized methyltransferase SCO7062 [uncultured Nocardioidaceae bacterium]
MTDGPAPDLASLVARLRVAGCVYAEEEAALLSEAANGLASLDVLAGRRLAGEPLEQVVGWVAFAGLRLAVAPDVFVPRRRTELLVREAARWAQPGAVVLDMCCGSGAVAAALEAAVPGLDVWATDVDPAAQACARRNLPPPARVLGGDLFAALPPALRGQVDLLVASPPYVPTAALPLMPREARLHEPRAALDGGHDGLAVHRRLLAEAVDWLAPGGHVVLECGEDQTAELTRQFSTYGLGAHGVHDALTGGSVVVGTGEGPSAGFL